MKYFCAHDVNIISLRFFFCRIIITTSHRKECSKSLMHTSFLKTYFTHILHKSDIHSIKNTICNVCLKVAKYVYLRKWKWGWFTESLHFRLLLYLSRQSHIWIECSPCIRKVVCLNSSRDRYKIVKTGSDSSTAKCSELGVSVKNPRKCQVTQYLWLKNLTVQRPNVPSKVKTLQLFTGNDDVSK